MQMQEFTVNTYIDPPNSKDQVKPVNITQTTVYQSPDELIHRKLMIDVYKTIPTNVKWSLILLIIGSIISTFLFALSLYAVIKSSSATSKALVTLSFSSIIIFAFGFFSIIRFKRKVEYILENIENNDLETIDQSKERTFLNIFIYLLMIDFIVFLILGVGSITCRDQVESEIRAIARDSSVWVSVFGSLPFSTVINNYRAVLYTFGGISFLLCVLLTLLFFNIFRGLGAYRTWQTIIEFITVIFFLLGFAFLYLATYVFAYREVSNVDGAVPNWLPIAFLIIAIFAILLSIVGYISSFMENLRMLKVFLTLAVVYTKLILLFSCISASNMGSIDSIIGQKNCLKLLDRINQNHLVQYVGCKQKYLFLQKDVANIKCPKDRILTAWEVNLGKPEEQQTNIFGCVDMSCCNQTFSYIKSKITWLILIAFVLVCAGICLMIGTFFMIKELNLGIEKGTTSKKVRWVLLIFVIITVSLFIIFLAMSPEVPAPDPVLVTNVNSASRSNTMVDNNMIPNSSNKLAYSVDEPNSENTANEGMLKLDIYEDTSKCSNGNCPYSILYTYNITSDYGFFTSVDKVSDNNVIITKNNTNEITFQCDINAIKSNKLITFSYTPSCPIYPAWVNLVITANAVEKSRMLIQKKNTFRYLQNEQTNTDKPSITIDVTAVPRSASLTYYNEDKDYSFTTSDLQFITGRVLFVSNSLERTPCFDCDVVIKSVDYPNCPSKSFKTNTQGYWVSDTFKAPVNNAAVSYTVTVQNTNYITYSRFVILGGIGWIQNVDIGNMELYSAVVVQERQIAPLKFRTVTSTITIPISTSMNSIVTTDQTVSAVQTVVTTNGLDSTSSTTNTKPPDISSVTTDVVSGAKTSDNNETSNTSSTGVTNPQSTPTTENNSANNALTVSTSSTALNSNNIQNTSEVNSTPTITETNSSTPTATETSSSTPTTTETSSSTPTTSTESNNTQISSNTDFENSLTGVNSSLNNSSTNNMDNPPLPESTVTINSSSANNQTTNVTPATLINSGVTKETSAVIETGLALIPIVINQGNQAQDNPIYVQEPIVIPNNQVSTDTVISTGASSSTITQTQTLVILDDNSINVNSFSSSAAVAHGAKIPSLSTLDNNIPDNIIIGNNGNSGSDASTSNTLDSTSSNSIANFSNLVTSNNQQTSNTLTGSIVDSNTPGINIVNIVTTSTTTNNTGSSDTSLGSNSNTSSTTSGTSTTNNSIGDISSNTLNNSLITSSNTSNGASSSNSINSSDGTNPISSASSSTSSSSSNSINSSDGTNPISSASSSTSSSSSDKNVSVVPDVIATTTNDLPITSTSKKANEVTKNAESTEVTNAVMTSMVINSLTNKAIIGVKIYLFRGNRKFNNYQITFTNSTISTNSTNTTSTNTTAKGNSNNESTKTDISKDPSLITSTISDQFGNFGFGNLGPNKYTLVFELDGYYRETVYFDIVGNKSGPISTISISPLIPPGQIRFVLSWPNGPKDLDLYSVFKVSSTSKCEVYFGRKSCVGGTLDAGNKDGGKLGVETITINNLGKYVYMILVNKYIDTCHGVAQGDTFSVVQFDDNNPVTSTSSTYSKAPDTTLAGSLGTVSVYSNFVESVFQLTIPNEIKSDNILSGSVDDAKNWNWWLAFCIDGTKGLNSLKTVNKFSKTKPDVSYCENLFK
jgi:hypothetical protein